MSERRILVRGPFFKALYSACMLIVSLQALEKVHETFESDVEAEIARVGQLERIARELESLNYYNVGAVNQRMQGIKDSFSSLQQLSDNRRERIQNAIVAQQKLDAMRLDYAKRAAVSGGGGGGGGDGEREGRGERGKGGGERERGRGRGGRRRRRRGGRKGGRALPR